MRRPSGGGAQGTGHPLPTNSPDRPDYWATPHGCPKGPGHPYFQLLSKSQIQVVDKLIQSRHGAVDGVAGFAIDIHGHAYGVDQIHQSSAGGRKTH